jgi:Ca2+-binding EF-hand superfamily protein
MKTTTVSMIFAALLAPSAVHAQAPDDDPSRRVPGERREQRPFHQAWQKADSDADGFISRAEFTAMPRVSDLPEDKQDRLFKRLDKDGDGRLDSNELWQPGNAPAGRRHKPMHRLWELDTDGDGGVSLEEFKVGPIAEKLPPERIERIFQRLDRDGDGNITAKDRPDPPQPGREGLMRGGQPDIRPRAKPEAYRLLPKLDKDNDRALTFEEFREHPALKNMDEDAQEARFQELDSNNDSKITPDEMRPLQPPGGRRRPGG